MTFKIIKPKHVKKPKPIDTTTVKTKLIEGLTNDIIVDIHTAVEYTGAENGSQVRGMLLSLKKELEKLSTKADELLREGKTKDEIVNTLSSMSSNFSVNDIIKYKIEVYGSISNWKKAITSVT